MPTARGSIAKEIRAIRAALRQLERSFGRLGPALNSAPSATPRTRRKLRLSPARKAALKLQGQYMGYMRGLKTAQKNKVKRVRETKGIRAAIAAARRLAS